MTKSYVIDPETGKLLTAREWKDKAGYNVQSAKMVAIVPEDGTPFAFPVETFKKCSWNEAMKLVSEYKAPHSIDGSDGTFTLPTLKQSIDIRNARCAGLEQLLELIGAYDLLRELRDGYGWTCETWSQPGRSEEEAEAAEAEAKKNGSSIRYAASAAWYYYYSGFSSYNRTRGAFTVRAVTLLKLDS